MAHGTQLCGAAAEVGLHFSVNRMLAAECYKQRMEKGLTFLEFNYMIMQSYDFYMLFQKYGCNMQFGGTTSGVTCWEVLG